MIVAIQLLFYSVPGWSLYNSYCLDQSLRQPLELWSKPDIYCFADDSCWYRQVQKDFYLFVCFILGSNDWDELRTHYCLPACRLSCMKRAYLNPVLWTDEGRNQCFMSRQQLRLPWQLASPVKMCHIQRKNRFEPRLANPHCVGVHWITLWTVQILQNPRFTEHEMRRLEVRNNACYLFIIWGILAFVHTSDLSNKE